MLEVTFFWLGGSDLMSGGVGWRKLGPILRKQGSDFKETGVQFYGNGVQFYGNGCPGTWETGTRVSGNQEIWPGNGSGRSEISREPGVWIGGGPVYPYGGPLPKIPKNPILDPFSVKLTPFP